MHATTIAKIEAGDRSVRIDEATGIADVFEVSLDSLLGRKDDDLAYALRNLREVAAEAMSDIHTIVVTVRDRLTDVFELEFEGRHSLEPECKRFFDSATDAEFALYNIAESLAPSDTARNELVDRMANARADELMNRQLEEIVEDGQEES